MKRKQLLLVAGICAFASSAMGQIFAPAEMSRQTKECLECHQKLNPSLYQQWGSSKHYRGNVGCYECHQADIDDVDAFKHEGVTIAILVTPKSHPYQSSSSARIACICCEVFMVYDWTFPHFLAMINI